MTILATIGLTPDQAVQVAKAYRLIEEATSAEGQCAEARTLRQERNARYYTRHKGERLNGVLTSLGASDGDLKRLTFDKESSPHTPFKEITTPLVDDKSSTPPSKRGTRLPEDWVPSEALISEGITKCGLTRSEVLGMAAEFVDFWIAIPGPKARKLTWDGTFRNRMRDQAPRYLKKPNRLIPEVNGNGNGVFIRLNTPQWDAWADRYKREGKKLPMSAKGGWHFPTEWPNSESLFGRIK